MSSLCVGLTVSLYFPAVICCWTESASPIPALMKIFRLVAHPLSASRLFSPMLVMSVLFFYASLCFKGRRRKCHPQEEDTDIIGFGDRFGTPLSVVPEKRARGVVVVPPSAATRELQPDTVWWGFKIGRSTSGVGSGTPLLLRLEFCSSRCASRCLLRPYCDFWQPTPQIFFFEILDDTLTRWRAGLSSVLRPGGSFSRIPLPTHSVDPVLHGNVFFGLFR